MKYAVYEGEGQLYATKTREFPSLRGAAEFKKTLPPETFLGVQAVDYNDLNEQEWEVWKTFTVSKS